MPRTRLPQLPASLCGLVAIAFFFAAGSARAAEPQWPKEIRSEKAAIVLYEPQVESMKGDVLKARAAFSLTPAGKAEPVFGVLWASARMRTDRDAGTAALVSATVDRIRFPEITEGEERELKALVEAEVGNWEIIVPLESLRALLAAADRERKTSEELSGEPPRILVEKELSVLVTLDGEPRLEAIEGTSLQRVVNTPFAILLDPKTKSYYLSNGEAWYRAPAATGPYAPVAKPPAEVAKVAEAARKEQQETEKEQGIAEKPKPAKPPKVVVTTEPAELVSFEGEPKWAPVAGLADLLYATNTESEVLKDVGGQLTYVLLSGRWFASRSIDGPWTLVAADRLPASFAKIPEGSPVGDVLPFVAGTEQAENAVLDAEIPQTTAISRADAKLDVAYDGAPQFEAVEGTSLKHAKNASTQVLSSGARYWACDQGVWYVADSPNGPWQVATERPPDVERIPPSSPAYQVKYVYVYDVTPTVVYVGYTPGYYGTYVWGPTIVYGTGYWYRPWYGRCYYPWPRTWGFHAGWNPWTGWSFGFGYTAGFYSYGWGWHAHWGWGWGPRYHVSWHGGWYGPGGWRRPYWGPSYRPGHTHVNVNVTINNYYRPRPGTRPAPGWNARPTNNIYSRPQNRMRNAPDRRVPTRETRVPATLSTRPAPGGTAPTTRPAVAPGTKKTRPAAPTRDVPRRPAVAKDKPNDVYADRDGNVYRRDREGWQSREKGRWSRPAPSTGAGAPSARPAPPRDLERDYTARQRSGAASPSGGQGRTSTAPPRGGGKPKSEKPKR